jgi:2-keto-4-pentenoate hydratase/2-oxohepta-3-ene-1,7-dioic acid hydratase in catechol pathway
MYHSVAKIISVLSDGTTLLAGTIILTGSPAGVGAARKPPVFLKNGDVVEVEIPGVGRVRNPVQSEK